MANMTTHNIKNDIANRNYILMSGNMLSGDYNKYGQTESNFENKGIMKPYYSR